MTRISVISLRISNSTLKSVLVVDSNSADRLKRARDPLLDEVDQCVVFDTPEGEDSYRNRFIKTNLRNFIDGQYLFLDSDMLVRGDLSELFSVDADIACAPNHSRDRFDDQIWGDDRAALSSMGWQTRRDVYVNGGLMLCNDTPGARRMAADWHRKWLDCYAQIGRYRDQPALNAAIFGTNVDLTVLSHRFNAQVKGDVRCAKDAAIWHCYTTDVEATGKGGLTTGLDHLVSRVLRTQRLSRSDVEALIHQEHPWRRTGWIDDMVAKRLYAKGVEDWGDVLWFEGRRLASLRYRLEKRAERCFKAARRQLKTTQGLCRK